MCASLTYNEHFLERKDENLIMIAISKAEKEYICERFPNVHIVRTMKQKSKRHHYYCEETKQVMRYLNEVRGLVPQRNKRSDVKGGFGEKARRDTV